MRPLLALFPPKAGLKNISIFDPDATNAGVTPPYPCGLHTLRPHIEVPAHELADGDELVIVMTMRKARDLSPKIEPSRPLSRPSIPQGRLLMNRRRKPRERLNVRLYSGF